MLCTSAVLGLSKRKGKLTEYTWFRELKTFCDFFFVNQE